MRKTEKALSLLLSLALMLGFLPWTAMPARAATSLPAAVNGTVTLTDDVTLSSTWVVSDAVTLDLNGFGVRYAGSANGSVIRITEGGSLTLTDGAKDSATRYVTLTDGRGTGVVSTRPGGTEGTDYLAVTGGFLTGGTGYVHNPDDEYIYAWGGGIFVDSGTLTMEGGTILGNTARSSGNDEGKYYGMGRGGGVYVDGGTFTMTGGAVSGNMAGAREDGCGDGGGVYVVGGTFVMTGGAILENEVTGSGDGGGVYMACLFDNNGKPIAGTKFTMTGGAIRGNHGAWFGGGVFACAEFEMSGGTIGGEGDGEKNHAKYGGGVYNIGTFAMSGDAAILGNSASFGGGVYVAVGRLVCTFTMDGGSVVAGNDQHGIYVEKNTYFTMNGGSITGNYIGVMIGDSDNFGGTFMMNGGSITGNGNGVYDFGTFVMNGGSITGNTSVGVELYAITFFVSGGATVKDNISRANNIVMSRIINGEDCFLTVTGELTGELHVDATSCEQVIAKADEGYHGGVLTYDDAKHFIADAEGLTVALIGGYPRLISRPRAPYTITAGSPGSNDYYGHHDCGMLLDGVVSTYWYSARENQTDGKWFVEFETDAPIVLSGYTLRADVANYAPSAWTLYGKTAADDEAWTLLDSETGYEAHNKDIVSRDVANTGGTAYRYFRFEVSNNNGSGVRLNELELRAAYDVTVVGGTGSGSYIEGTTVTVKANKAEAGKRFKEWMGADDLTFTGGGATTATASFVMPAHAVTLTAVYEDITCGVSGLFDENGRLTAYVTGPDGALLIAAAYDESGKPLEIRIIEIVGYQAKYDTGIVPKNGNICKLMLVDCDTFAPLCAAWDSETSVG